MVHWNNMCREKSKILKGQFQMSAQRETNIPKEKLEA